MIKRKAILSITVASFMLATNLTIAYAGTDDNSIKYLLTTALANVTDEKESLNLKFDELRKTGSARIYDELVAKITNSALIESDKVELLSRLDALGKDVVFTQDYTEAIKAVVNAGNYFTEGSFHEPDELYSVEKRATLADKAVNNVKNIYSKDYLKEQLQGIRAKDNTFVKNKGITLGDIKLFDNIKNYDKNRLLKYYSGSNIDNIEYISDNRYVGIKGDNFYLTLFTKPEYKNDLLDQFRYVSLNRSNPLKDLKLLNISIGDSEEKVLKTFGEPLKRENDLNNFAYNSEILQYRVKLIDELYEVFDIYIDKNARYVTGFSLGIPTIQFKDKSPTQTIIQNQSANLPSVITAETKSGVVFKLPVKWDNLSPDTSKVGNLVVTGKIACFDLPVNYTLKIMPAKTGWVMANSKWYFYKDDGSMAIGWVKSNEKLYYMDSSGAMQTGWIQIDGKWYYFEPGGAVQTGWAQLGGKWYYFESSGQMRTGWLNWNNKKYYFNDDGSMAVNTSVGEYSIDSNGIATKNYKQAGMALSREIYKIDTLTVNIHNIKYSSQFGFSNVEYYVTTDKDAKKAITGLWNLIFFDENGKVIAEVPGGNNYVGPGQVDEYARPAFGIDLRDYSYFIIEAIGLMSYPVQKSIWDN